jgi:hypothetical protein
MEAICKKCGAKFILDGEMPQELECLCSSKEFNLEN